MSLACLSGREYRMRWAYRAYRLCQAFRYRAYRLCQAWQAFRYRASLASPWCLACQAHRVCRAHPSFL